MGKGEKRGAKDIFNTILYCFSALTFSAIGTSCSRQEEIPDELVLSLFCCMCGFDILRFDSNTSQFVVD